MPTVSIIIPNYNHGRFLRQRIESVLAQTCQDFELILLDDASSDDSRSILQQYAQADPRVHTCFNDTNSGSAFAQWNKGVSLARGRYIWIAESDDWAEPTFLAKAVGVLDAHPGVGLVHCRSWWVDEQDRRLDRTDLWNRRLHPTRWTTDHINDGRDEIARYLLIQNIIPNASAVLFRKSLYDAVGGASEQYRLTGDWHLWLRMLARGDVAYLSEPLNNYRVHRASVRASSMTNGLILRESYAVLNFARRELGVPQASMRRALQRLANRWVGMTLDCFRGRLPLGRSAVLLREAWRVDGWLPLRLLWAGATLPLRLITGWRRRVPDGR